MPRPVFRARLRAGLCAVALGQAFTLSACEPAGTTVPADAARARLALDGLDCGSCGEEAAMELAKLPGVYGARFDAAAVRIDVAYDAAATDPAALMASLGPRAKKDGFTLREGERGSYLGQLKFDEGLDVQQLSREGEFVELEPNLAKGKVTIVDFHAAWCGPCRDLDAALLERMRANPQLALRKLDVVDWDSPVAKSYLRDVPALPYVEVYDAKGKRVARISGLEIEKLDAAIAKAQERGS